MKSVLCIGGPLNGKQIVIEKDKSYFRIHRPRATSEFSFEEILYKRIDFCFNQKVFEIFVPGGQSESETLSLLVENLQILV
jgi:hypothetical protein